MLQGHRSVILNYSRTLWTFIAHDDLFMQSVAQAGLEPLSSCFSLLRAGITIQLQSPGSVITLMMCEA